MSSSAPCSCETQSLASRLGYGLLLTCGAFLMYIFSLHGLDNLTNKFPFCGHNMSHSARIACEENPGAVTVFRFSLIYVVYFLLLAIIMIRVKNSQDFRFIIQNGCWPLKVLVVVAAMVSSVFIPIGAFDHVWFFVCMSCSVIFILILIFVIIYIGHVVTDSLLSRQQEGEKWAFVIYFGISIVTQIGAAVAAALMLYTFPLCEINMVLVIGNLVFSYVATMWTFSPCAKDSYGHGGLFYGGILSCIVMFTTWTAISANPDKSCNPISRQFNKFYYVFPVIAMLLTILLYLYAAYILKPSYPVDFEDSIQQRTVAPMSLSKDIPTASFGYQEDYSVRKIDPRLAGTEIFHFEKVGAPSRVSMRPETSSVTTMDTTQNVLNKKFEAVSSKRAHGGAAGTVGQIFRTGVGVSRDGDDEKEHVVYYWSFSHFVIGTGVAFLLMTYTYWSPPNGSEDRDYVDFAAMWYKAAISILINIFFIFTMYVPTAFGYFIEPA